VLRVERVADRPHEARPRRFGIEKEDRRRPGPERRLRLDRFRFGETDEHRNAAPDPPRPRHRRSDRADPPRLEQDAVEGYPRQRPRLGQIRHPGHVELGRLADSARREAAARADPEQ
jgi:hypothetical protein